METFFLSYVNQLWICPRLCLSSNQSVSFQFSLVHSVMSDSLRPHEMQHARLPCLSPTPRAYSNACLLIQWCNPTISSSVIPFSLPSIFPSIRVFSNGSGVCIRWPKYFSFSFNNSPSNEYSGLTSFRIDWLDLLAVTCPVSMFYSCKGSLKLC